MVSKILRYAQDHRFHSVREKLFIDWLKARLVDFAHFGFGLFD